MKIAIFYLLIAGSYIYAGPPSTDNTVQMNIENLEQVDRQIESLIKQKVALKALELQEIEQGGTSSLPTTPNTPTRSAATTAQQIEIINEQLQALEAQRQVILSSLQ